MFLAGESTPSSPHSTYGKGHPGEFGAKEGGGPEGTPTCRNNHRRGGADAGNRVPTLTTGAEPTPAASACIPVHMSFPGLCPCFAPCLVGGPVCRGFPSCTVPQVPAVVLACPSRRPPPALAGIPVCPPSKPHAPDPSPLCLRGPTGRQTTSGCPSSHHVL